MNEPYQHVHKQEDSNSTIGTISKHISASLAMSAAIEGGSVLLAKKINGQKHPQGKEFFHNLAYAKGSGNNRLMKGLTSGVSTKAGRIANYGGSVIGGLLTGTISSSQND